MTRPLWLTTDELVTTLDVVNPLGLLVAEITGSAAGNGSGPVGSGAVGEPGGTLTPWAGADPDTGEPATGRMLFEDHGTGTSCVLPTAVLTAFRTATLVALTARELVAPGVVTAAMLGSDFPAQTTLTLLARHLSGLSHVAVCPTGSPAAQALPGWVTTLLDKVGISWEIVAKVTDAIFGATLVVATVATPRWLEIRQHSSGATLINATGVDLSDSLVDAVDQVYVDDARLIEANAHRYFARMHLAGPDAGSVWLGKAGGERLRRVRADLAQLLTDKHAGRTNLDDVLLVELIGLDELDVQLACGLHRAARAGGLGVEVPDLHEPS